VLKLIIGEVKNEEKESVMNGILWRHPTLRLGHVAQHDVEALVLEHGNETPVEYLGEKLKEHPDSAAMAGTTGSIRQYLGAYGLGGKHANRVIASLSGGERMRLCFAATFAMRPHLLLLGELDIFLLTFGKMKLLLFSGIMEGSNNYTLLLTLIQLLKDEPTNHVGRYSALLYERPILLHFLLDTN